jgi:NAD(P)-dependent dehydrogenase (short-subunit alcohol dehydrogenase family)
MIAGMTDLSGRVVLVTGGNSGIGLGMAMGVAEAGADVAIWGTNPDKNAAAAERLAATGRRVHTERCDVSDEAAVERSFAATVEALGKVDSVFANAGTGGATPGVWELSTEEWRRVLGVNLDGTFFTMRAAARHLVERGEGGSLVLVASTSTIHGAPNQPHYAASKTALLGLTRSMAVSLARHRVRVNAISPGWTDTDMLAGGKANEKFVRNTISRTPVRRWADPDEFGPVAVYLADPALTFHTGDTLVVDGAYTIY